MSNELEKYEEQIERQEHLEHRDALLAIGSIIQTDEGAKLFKYLFKTLDVAELPPQGMQDNVLHEYLGFLRAGNSIYKLACEADSEKAAHILSNIEREKYDELIRRHKIESGFNTESDD